ncbi:MAG: glycosyl transferase [Deltaproteobacteria bacterium]|nr:MAG: glycosyl transferase [Deltaproteobacteria bacterium]
MKIIQVVNVRFFNATAWYALYLSRLLIQAGHEVYVLGLEGTESFAKGRSWGLPMYSLPLNTQTPWGLIRLYRDLNRLITNFKPDIVNCHRGESFILWGLLRRLKGGFKLVRTRGDQRLPKANIFNQVLHRRMTDAVISTNTRMTKHFATSFHLAPDHLFQVIGGVDHSIFHPDPRARAQVRREWGYDDQDMVIGLVGRFDRVKGQKELIEAVARAATLPRSYKVKLMLLGFETDTSEAQVRQWIRDNKMEAITVITGKRADVAACINALDVGVVASLWSETIARAALEIMACAVPLIGTSVGVMPDLLAPHALVPPGDVTALTACLNRCLKEPVFLQTLRMEQASRMKNLSEGSFLSQTLAIYEALVDSTDIYIPQQD